MDEVKTKMYLNALKCVFPYDNKAISKLISRKKNESDDENPINQNGEICPQWLEHMFHRAGMNELLSLGLTETQIRELLDKRSKVDPEAEYALLLKENVSLISRNSADYPSLLREIPDAPEILYMQGKKSVLINQKNKANNHWNMAVVGTRAPSGYGKEITERIIKDLTPYNPVVVSGLAIGIDQAAHESAIEYGLPTIAVLGAGHGSLKPKCGLRLIKKLLDENLIISEYPYNTEANKFTFPMRNRIICGMSLATLVIEARSRSGALITARLAHGYDRAVFAVPGSILSTYSRGTNGLIQNMIAELFLDVPTMIASINVNAQLEFKEMRQTGPTEAQPAPPEQIKPEIKDPSERKIYDNLKFPMDTAEILTMLELGTQEALIALTKLEMSGLIKETPNQKWIRTA